METSSQVSRLGRQTTRSDQPVQRLRDSHARERYVLFVRPRDREMEIWNGRRAGVEGAVAITVPMPPTRSGSWTRGYETGASPPAIWCEDERGTVNAGSPRTLVGTRMRGTMSGAVSAPTEGHVRRL